jgi:hypothetical protein
VTVAVAVGVGVTEGVGVVVGVAVAVGVGVRVGVGVGVGLPQVPPNCRSYSTGWLLLGFITTMCAGGGNSVNET